MVNPPTAAGREVRTTDGLVLVCFFIGREYNPVTDTGPLPSHSILLGGMVIPFLPAVNIPAG